MDANYVDYYSVYFVHLAYTSSESMFACYLYVVVTNKKIESSSNLPNVKEIMWE